MKSGIGQKSRHNHPDPADPPADEGGPAEEKVEGVEKSDEQEDGAGGEVEGALGHEGLLSFI